MLTASYPRVAMVEPQKSNNAKHSLRPEGSQEDLHHSARKKEKKFWLFSCLTAIAISTQCDNECISFFLLFDVSSDPIVSILAAADRRRVLAGELLALSPSN